MERDIELDLKSLKSLAFKRAERCGPLLERFHNSRAQINSYPESELMWRVYDWLCTPFSLWPIDFGGLAAHLLGVFEATGQVEEDVIFLLDLVGKPPEAEARAAVASFEHIVESGNYDHLLRSPEKFAETEAAIQEDESLAVAWQKIKMKWDTQKLQNSRGVIRRRLSQERNMRSEWNFDWQDSRRKFELFFDAMCYRWKLYGMEHDKPLLLKVSVNPTPHGTMIVIPRHLSLDPVRDLDWSQISKLHRARGASRQGRKLSANRMEVRREALQVKKYWDQAGAKKIRGERRYDYIYKQMNKRTIVDRNWVHRQLRRAKTFLARK